MDRNKAQNRGSKSKMSTVHCNSDLYVLGTKTSREEKSKIFSFKNACSNDRKREASSSHFISSKKSKPGLIYPQSNFFDDLSPGIAIEESEPVEQVTQIFSDIVNLDSATTIKELCHAVKLLRSSRGKTDEIFIIFLMYLTKVRPDFFSDATITNILVSTLHRDVLSTFKGKSINSQILVLNILYRSYSDEKYWPEQFLQCYIDDAINDRMWADNELCFLFTKTICSSFGTRVPPKAFLQNDSSYLRSASGNVQEHKALKSSEKWDNVSNKDFEKLLYFNIGNYNIAYCIKNRYLSRPEDIEKCVTEAIKDHFNKRQCQDCFTRNFLKFLCSTSGIAEVRYISISRLELWIHNGKLLKPAQELLSYICFNIRSRCIKDQEVLASLVKLRLKTKPLINLYLACLKELVSMHSCILPIILKIVLQNELSNARNPNNMGILATLFQSAPDQSARNLADIYKEFLMQKEDCLRTLRVFLRELVRMLRFDINIAEFCKVLLNGKSEMTSQIEHSEYKERIFHSTVDITCLCMFLATTPQVREACVSLRNGRESNKSQVLLNFYLQISRIQLDAVSWMYAVVPNIYKPDALDFSQALHKLLLLESSEQYSRCDQWPSEPERSTLLRIISETPICEDTLLRIILIGITQDIPYTISETFEVLVSVIKRASSFRNIDMPAVYTNKYEIIDFLFSMAEYHYPEKIKLPDNYEPPKLAIIAYYWKVWIIMLMISAHNVPTFGAFCCDHYPTMKMLMEMCITNQCKDYITAKEELQISIIEHEQIVELEAYFAPQAFPAISEENSNFTLSSQVMLMDPMGPPRRIPPSVLEQLKHLNKTLKLGHLLCRSRKPDFLLEIINRQGSTQSLPWLSDLVQSSEGEFHHLPVQCLCEFLLFNIHIFNEGNSRDGKLLAYLRKLIIERNSDKPSVCEMLDYIFRRLSSTVKQSRISAYAVLKLLLQSEDWLLVALPKIPYFKDVRPFIVTQLRLACQVENIPEYVMFYIQFIASHTQNDPVNLMLDHVMDMAQLIVERNTMFHHITSMPFQSQADVINRHQKTLKCLFAMFNNYFMKLREPQNREPYECTQYPDLLMVQFSDGSQLPLHLNIIHAIIILLTHSSTAIAESMTILENWFPIAHSRPQAYVPDFPNDQVQLIPDWLKLKLIRSSTERLIAATLCDLTPDQIVLFVQNFGTPVPSMSKLLALLDHAVIEQFEIVRNAILNRAYLAQLIEIQQGRGAKNGHITVHALELHSHVPNTLNFHRVIIDKLEIVQFHVVEFRNYKKEGKIKQFDYNDDLYNAMKVSKINILNFRKLIHKMSELCRSTIKCRDFQINIVQQINEYLLNLVEDSNIQKSLSYRNRKYICTILRVLLKVAPELGDLTPIEYINKMFINIKNKIMENENTASLLPILQSPFKLYLEIEDEGGFQISKNVSTESFIKQSQQQCICLNLVPEFNKIGKSRINFNKIINSFQTDSSGICSDCWTEYTHYGIMVDWLVEVDPELITVNKPLQINLMFSKTYTNFHFYLLSFLCHETNWDTLHETLNCVLQNFRTEFNQTAILNFIEAVVNNPRLWKGQEKCISKYCKADLIHLLNRKNIQVLTQYVFLESELEVFSEYTQCCDRLSSRVDLLYQVFNNNSFPLIDCIEFALEYPFSTSVSLKFIQYLYMTHPKIKFAREAFSQILLSKFQNIDGFRSDRVSNYLITCLGNLFTKKDFESIFIDLELLMRKLAASHPLLLLRQFGAFCSQIQGKAHINMRILRDEHHIQRFTQILRTFKFLQPMIFYDDYKGDFQTCLDCYFTFFKYHMHEKEIDQIVLKFAELLHEYIKKNPSSAFIYLEKYTFVLQKLAINFNFLLTLQKLVQGLSLLKHKSVILSQLEAEEIKQEFDFYEIFDIRNFPGTKLPLDNEADESELSLHLENGCKISLALAFPEVQKQALKVSPNIYKLMEIIKHSSSEEIILGPLIEIESLSSKRFSILHEIFDRLLELIYSPSAQVRCNAYILLIRHLKQQHDRSDVTRCTLNAFVQCLSNDSSSIASTALDNLVEITLLLQEHSIDILGVAFLLGIKSRMNTSAQIKRVMQALLLQQGY